MLYAKHKSDIIFASKVVVLFLILLLGRMSKDIPTSDDPVLVKIDNFAAKEVVLRD